VPRRFRTARWIVGAGALAAAAWLIGFMMQGRQRPSPPIAAPVAAPPSMPAAASATPAPEGGARQSAANDTERAAATRVETAAAPSASAAASPMRRARGHAPERRPRFGSNHSPLIE